MRRRLALLAPLLMLFVAACGSDDDGPADETPEPTAVEEVADPGDSTTAAAEDAAGAEADDASPGGDGDGPWLDLGVPLITGLEAEPGPEGTILRWPPVDGTERYEVLAFAPDGTLAWSWAGSELEVLLGGPAPVLEPALDQLTPGSTWVVLAVDADAAPLAVSSDRALPD